MVDARPPENLPDSPGVYLFRGDKGKLLYVGKARSLKKRIATYFGAGPEDAKTAALLRGFRDLETIVTRTELEALLLENTLIKKHRPRYNICLRDDKTYPYIKITTGEAWPRALVTRRVLEDGHSYFGPFWGGLARRIMRMITRHFQIRTCTIEIDGKLPRPCLYYDLHACLGPCVAGLTTREAYGEAVADVILFLQGRNEELETRLEAKMEASSGEENFEMAAAYRDALRTVRDVSERQVVQSLKGENVDVFGFFESGQDVAVVVLVVRGGVLQDRRDFFFEKSQELQPSAFLDAFLPQFYDANPFLPSEVHLPVNIGNPELLEEFLAARRGAKVSVRVPQRGAAVDRLRMAEVNARERHRIRFRRTGGDEAVAAEKLGRAIGLAMPPHRIEAFDISHTQGTDSVASMVVFEDGRPRKSEYRLFNIAAQTPPRARRLPLHVRGRRATLPAGQEIGRPVAGSGARRRRPRAAPGGAHGARPAGCRAAGRRTGQAGRGDLGAGPAGSDPPVAKGSCPPAHPAGTRRGAPLRHQPPPPAAGQAYAANQSDGDPGRRAGASAPPAEALRLRPGVERRGSGGDRRGRGTRDGARRDRVSARLRVNRA